MVLSQRNLIKDGTAAYVNSLIIVVRTIGSMSSHVTIRLNVEHGGTWSSLTIVSPIAREGYNVISHVFPPKQASYAELEILEMQGVERLFYAAIGSTSEVAI